MSLKAYDLRRSFVAILVIIVLAFFLLEFCSFNFEVKAQDSNYQNSIALWPLDEIYLNNITPDVSGFNNGTLAGSPLPNLVLGKIGQALSFQGKDFLYVPISQSLDFQKEFTIEAWINVKAFRNNTHNNILVKCTRDGPDWIHVSRIVGLAIKAGLDEYGFKIPQGGLGGFVFTEESGFNEIVTKEPVISLNGTWKS